MRTGQAAIKLLLYRPGLFLLTILFRGADDLVPFLTGLVMKAFFDALTGDATSGIHPGGPLWHCLSLSKLATGSPCLDRQSFGPAGGTQ